jgi:flavin reductase (DIM6/NTAB) family NADH-FMN oxidoreductase RutF
VSTRGFTSGAVSDTGGHRTAARSCRYGCAVIDRDLKRALGQMVKGVQVVAAIRGDEVRAYTSHWVCQVSFEEPIVLVSISPKHDTHAVLTGSGRFAVSLLAGDQIAEGQYFSYPGRRFLRVASEYLTEVDGWHVVPGSIAWLGCEVTEQVATTTVNDHALFLARVVACGEGRLEEPALLYSSRAGWRVAGGPAREPGVSIRDQLLARLEQG